MLLGLPPSRIVLPPHYEDAARRYLQVSNELQGNPPLEYELLPLQVSGPRARPLPGLPGLPGAGPAPCACAASNAAAAASCCCLPAPPPPLTLQMGQEIQLASGYIVRPFPTTHTLPSQGYVLYSQRKKLKAELQGRSQDEIRQMRLSGAEVTETIEVGPGGGLPLGLLLAAPPRPMAPLLLQPPQPPPPPPRPGRARPQRPPPPSPRCPRWRSQATPPPSALTTRAWRTCSGPSCSSPR
jgi:hypothetical protein